MHEGVLAVLLLVEGERDALSLAVEVVEYVFDYLVASFEGGFNPSE